MASIIVVGGGLAGLVCGARLLRAGHEVEIIEAASAMGGRLRPIETEVGLISPAVGEVGWGDANLRALVAGLGLEASQRGSVNRPRNKQIAEECDAVGYRQDKDEVRKNSVQ